MPQTVRRRRRLPRKRPSGPIRAVKAPPRISRERVLAIGETYGLMPPEVKIPGSPLRLPDTYAAHAHVFAWGADEHFARLARVFEASCAAFGVDLKLHDMSVPQQVLQSRGATANHNKLAEWVRIIESTDRPVILLDADLVCKGDPLPGFEHVRYFGVTARPSGQRFPYNGGVVYARPTEVARKFFRAWLAADNLLFKDQELVKPFRYKYAGMNQASLGLLLELGWDRYMGKVSCEPYNVVDPWQNWESGVFVHFKSKLRKSVLKRAVLPMSANGQAAARWWLDLEKKLIKNGRLTREDLTCR